MNTSLSRNLAEAKALLQAAKRDLQEEITSYPTPISGCDAQFNYMLAERRKVQAAINALVAEVHIPTPRAP